jgi:hypothetical protein
MSNNSGCASNGSDQNSGELLPPTRIYRDAKKEPFISARPGLNQTVTASDTTQIGPHVYVIGQVPASMKPAKQDAGNATAAANGVNGHQTE